MRWDWGGRWQRLLPGKARDRTSAAQPIRLVRVGRPDQTWEQGARDWRAYEVPLPQSLVGLARISDGAFYDVGANCGYYAALLGRLGVAARIACFEPLPDILPRLRTNLWVNSVDAEVAEVALSDGEGKATLHLPPDSHGLVETSASLSATFKTEIGSTVEVRTTTADAFNAARGNEKVGLVKIDVEGADHLVLQGAHGLVARDRPLMTIELVPGVGFDVVTEFLARHDYVLVPLFADRLGAITREAEFLLAAHNQALLPAERADEAIVAMSDRSAVDALVAGAAPADAKRAALRARDAERLARL